MRDRPDALERDGELAGISAAVPLVITHGEPHAGYVMRAGRWTHLIDWDAAALVLPERDLWLLLDHGNIDVLRDYEDRTGRAAFYRLRWAFEELVGAVRDLDAGSTRKAVDDARPRSAGSSLRRAR